MPINCHFLAYSLWKIGYFWSKIAIVSQTWPIWATFDNFLAIFDHVIVSLIWSGPNLVKSDSFRSNLIAYCPNLTKNGHILAYSWSKIWDLLSKIVKKMTKMAIFGNFWQFVMKNVQFFTNHVSKYCNLGSNLDNNWSSALCV